MKIIAIDPGYDRCGVAILETTPSGEALIFSECITTSKELPFIERLGAIVEGVRRAAAQYAPAEMAIEKLFFNKNQKTAMMVAEVRGALIELGRSQGLSVHEYTPGEVKVAVTGDGASNKRQVAFMAEKLLKVRREHIKDDEYDAMAIGITHLAVRRGREHLSTRK